MAHLIKFKIRGLQVVALILAVAMSAIVSVAVASTLPAGVPIINMASATFWNQSLGIRDTVYSNPVEVRVAEVPAIDVTGFSDQMLSRGALDQHHFTVENTGNTPLSVSMNVDQSAEGGLLSGARLFWDKDANGRLDASDPQITPGQMTTLAMGERAELIYTFGVINGAIPGDIAISMLNVSATSVTSAEPAAGPDTAYGFVTISDRTVELEKSVARRSTDTADELSYTLNLRNNAETPIDAYSAYEGERITIDGTLASGVILRDEIPLNTVFGEFGPSGDLTPLFHLRGEASQTYQTTAPADPGEVDAVAFFHSGPYGIGKSTDVNFSVVLPRALGTVAVENVGQVYLPGADGSGLQQSNRVVTYREAEDVARMDFVDPASGLATSVGYLDSDAELQIVSGACNTTNEIDVIEIEVQSRTSRDVETILARETGANTGIFRSVPLPLIEMRSPVSGDGVMSASKGDVLDALSRCDGKRMTSQIEINPGSFVFNSVTNAPVSGAEVQVLDASGAMVASATTDAQGYFTLGELPAGTYRYEVLPPAAFSFPSVRLDFPGYGRNSAGQEAYGASFTHAGGHVSFTDIPVDPYYGVPLVLEKSADKDRISIGEFVTYTLRAQNNMNQALVYSQMTDRLPHGATMVPGSVQLDGEPWADPAGDGSGDYVFDLGLIHPLQTRVLTYVVRFTPLAKEGRLYNSAVLSGSQAGTGQARVSNTARTYVRMDNSGGVFARQGTILGTVFLDCDENGRQDPGVDPGIPGVTIITQEGLSVVTDINGKYSLFGMRPVSHVLAVQASTLPKDTAARVTQVSDMLQAGSRMVSLKRGGLMAENFAIGGCSVATRHAVGHRVSTFLERNPGGAPIAADLPMDPAVAGPRSARSEAGLATTTQIARASLDGGAEQSGDLAAKAQKAAEAKATLESIVRTLTPEPAFLNVQDNARAARKSLSVRVKGPADLKLRLELNGTEIGESQIGEKTVWAGGNVQALEFVALRLVAGENRLALIGIGPFGNERARKEVTVIAAGDPEKIEIIAPKSARATPGTPVPVIVRFLDGQGRPVQASGNVTLHAGNSRWDVRDNRSDQPGVQAYIDNGEATFGLLPSQVAGPDTITVQSGYGRAEAKILFTPDLDQRIMVGIIEGSVALKGGAELIDHQDLSAFEDTTTGLRGELYLKGRIRGDALLTLRYSSDRDTDDRMFRDIRGDEYYPVYGDNSERGFDAQSSSTLL